MATLSGHLKTIAQNMMTITYGYSLSNLVAERAIGDADILWSFAQSFKC